MPNSRVAIVSTVREPGASFISWLRYHRAIGFEHIFLFLDDPHDPCQEIARAFPQVSVILNNDALRARYASLSSYPRLARQSGAFHYARQILNMELGARLAHAEGFRWLMHIDDDEMVFTPQMAIAPLFERYTQGRVDQIAFLNQEALPTTWEVADRFREVTHFKLNPWQVPSHLQAEVMQFWTAKRGGYFAGYVNGKSAVRLLPGLTAKGVHRFYGPAGEIPTEPATDAYLLHYAHCGYANFRRKFAMWGRFPDSLADGSPMTTGFQQQCRDTLIRGDEAAYRSLYEAQVMMASGVDLARQMALGLVLHNPEPADLLHRLNG
jgi:hypothetical protein